MAAKRGGSRGKKPSTPHRKSRGSRRGAKVGSDRAADRGVGGKLDFGIPVASKQVQPIGGRDKGPQQGTGPMRSGSRPIRDSGVGRPPGPAGAGSGGDLDPDFIGLDGKGGVAAHPEERRTQGPDITEGGSAPFASGPPAEGEGELPPGRHGAPPQIVRGSTVDRSGGSTAESELLEE